jgi:hypothetical protein
MIIFDLPAFFVLSAIISSLPEILILIKDRAN